MKRLFPKLSILAGMLIGLPIIGIVCVGLPVSRYLEFPPETRYIAHAPFSWCAFVVFCIIPLAALIPLVLKFRIKSFRGESGRPDTGAFPWWGWLGLVAGMLAWILAWNRFPWFEKLQPHTFAPLWFSYILVVNALSHRRTGHCLMIDRPGYFLVLFPFSALFWWFFEYLNRFVQNWYYVGVQFPAWEYFLYATLPFSTVLPAVLSTQNWIASGIRVESRSESHPVSAHVGPTAIAWATLIASGAGLAVIGVWPNYLFPLLWVSPLLIIVSLQELMGETHIFSQHRSGGWRNIVSAALAALICGFFWEMWNVFSLARWEYGIPFVHRFLVFEMPILGYAGYLPFGLECMTIGRIIDPRN